MRSVGPSRRISSVGMRVPPSSRRRICRLLHLPLWVVISLSHVPAMAEAKTIAGQANVIDGDTIEIDQERINILDIDAPELGQDCFASAEGGSWPCGQIAARALSDWIAGHVM